MRSTFAPIQYLIRGHLNAGMVAIVLGKLDKRKVIILTTFEIDNTSSQNILYGLNGTLCLSIRLRMKCYAKVNLSTKTLLK